MKPRTSLIIGVILGMPLGAVTFVGWAMFGDQSSYDEHLPSLKGLPAKASDISVYQQEDISGLVIAHFEISEANFVEWANAHECELEEIYQPMMVNDPLLYWLDYRSVPVYIVKGLFGSHSQKTNPIFPMIRLRSLPLMLGIAFLGAVVGGSYGIAHDLITYSLSSEYFTHLKFQQFSYIDFGFSERVLAAEIGFLATWWMGFFAAWFLARMAVPAWPPRQAVRRTIVGFVIILATAISGSAIGYFVGLKSPIDSDWLDYCELLGVRDAEAFVRVAYIHNGGYIGCFVGLVTAIILLRKQRPRKSLSPSFSQRETD